MEILSNKKEESEEEISMEEKFRRAIEMNEQFTNEPLVDLGEEEQPERNLHLHEQVEIRNEWFIN
jgi:hypothetical protein